MIFTSSKEICIFKRLDKRRSKVYFGNVFIFGIVFKEWMVGRNF